MSNFQSSNRDLLPTAETVKLSHVDNNLSPEAQLRALPAVQKLLDEPRVRELAIEFGRDAVVIAAREALADLRTEILSGNGHGNGAAEDVIARVVSRVERRFSGGVRRAINATGVILHTGLGRAVLPQAAIDGIVSEVSGYASVEVDVESGKRGHRDETVRDLIATL